MKGCLLNDDGEVEVHALTCPRAQVLKASFGPRIVATRWDKVAGHFLANIRIEGIDRHGILQELTGMISTALNIDIRRLNIEAEKKCSTAISEFSSVTRWLSRNSAREC